MVANESEGEERKEAPDWLIDNIAEASKNARKIYFLYMGYLAYCALTVVSTTDRQIILNETARLPIVNLDVSLNGFFILAPLLAIFVFVYLQLYLQRLNGLISDLRTNYTPIEKRRLYPWMLNIAEDPEPGVIGRLQRSVVAFSLWWSLPIVLILFAFWFVRKHDPLWCYVVGLLPILGTSVVIWFWCRYEFLKLYGLIRRFIGKIVLGFIVVIFELFMVSFVVPNALEGDIDAVRFLWPWTCVDLGFQKLVNEPSVEYEGIYWADLRGLHLEGADLTSTVLKRADLRGAQFQRAQLESANLEGANLREANLEEANIQQAHLYGVKGLTKDMLQEARNCMLAFYAKEFLDSLGLPADHDKKLRIRNLSEYDFKGANLRGADLQGADLVLAKLQGADLRWADLQETFLKGADLQGADLQGADLSQSNLEHAVLWGTDLRGAEGLTIEQLSRVKTLYQAKLDSTLMEQIRKDYPHLLEEPKGDE